MVKAFAVAGDRGGIDARVGFSSRTRARASEGREEVALPLFEDEAKTQG